MSPESEATELLMRDEGQGEKVNHDAGLNKTLREKAQTGNRASSHSTKGSPQPGTEHPRQAY